MPVQTVVCPDCANQQSVDIPIGTRAQLIHRPDGDLLRVAPNVMPIPERSGGLKTRSPFLPLSSPQPSQVDLNRGD